MNGEDFMVAEAMERYGGSFVQTLGLLAKRADAKNLEMIKSTWQNYWLEYLMLSKKERHDTYGIPPPF